MPGQDKVTLSDSSYEASLNLTSKPDKNATGKDNRPISLRNIDAKNPQKLLTNQIQQHIKGICTMIKWDLFLGCKSGLILENQYYIPYNK